MCQYNIDRWVEETRLTIEPSPAPPGPGAPNTDWRIPITRRYYAQFLLPRNTDPRGLLPVPGPPHPSRLNVPLRPLNWRRGRHLPHVSTIPTPQLSLETTSSLERLDMPGHYLHSIDYLIVSSPARPPQTPRANTWPPADLTPTAESFTYNVTTPPDEASGSSNSSPHSGSYVSGMSIAPLTPLPTPGMSRRNALPVRDPGLPDSPPPRRDNPGGDAGSDDGSGVWHDEETHGVADYDEGDIERARNPPPESPDISPRTAPSTARASRFVENMDVSAPEGYFD